MTEQQRPRPFVARCGKKVGKVRTECSRTMKCRWCGKKFERPTDEWGWKLGDKHYCTYTCMRNAEKATPKRLRGERIHRCEL